LAAVGFSKLLYWTEDQFEKLPIDEVWWPAIGALGLGVIGYFTTVSMVLNVARTPAQAGTDVAPLRPLPM
jgi:H+/Cl- antiporter ClcA